MSDSQPTDEELLDGLALWDEHKPQSGPDWVAVAGRTLAAGEDGSKGSPLFHALIIQTARAEQAEAEVERLKRHLAASDYGSVGGWVPLFNPTPKREDSE